MNHCKEGNTTGTTAGQTQLQVGQHILNSELWTHSMVFSYLEKVFQCRLSCFFFCKYNFTGISKNISLFSPILYNKETDKFKKTYFSLSV